MKRILCFTIIMFIGFITFSKQQQIDPSEIETVKMNKVYLEDKEQVGINKYGYLVFKQSDKDLKFVSLTLAVIKAESDFEHDVTSSMGAVGLMQLMPDTALDTSKELGIEIGADDLVDPEVNIKLGTSYIRYLQKRLSQIEDEEKRLALILASYNSGLHRVKRSFKCRGFECYIQRANLCDYKQFNENLDTLPEETKDYLKNVKIYYKKYRKVFNAT